MSEIKLAYTIEFNGGDLSKEQFYVLSFEGKEHLNEFYTFDISIISTKPIDSKQFLKTKNRSIKLKMSFNGKDRYIHGICTQATMKNMIDNSLIVYDIRVSHPISKLSIGQTSKVFLEMTIEEIVSSILKNNELTQGTDYEFDLSQAKYDKAKENYEEIDFLCQYNENNFKFIQRWIADFGINMFFESDENGSKIIFTDHSNGFKGLENNLIEYYPSLVNRKNNVNIISDIEISEIRVPLSLSYTNNDLSQDESVFAAVGIIDDEERSDSEEFTCFGGTPLLQKNIERYKAIEEERFKSRSQTIAIKSDVVSMCPGFKFGVDNHHFLEGDALLTTISVEHKGNQLSLLKRLETIGKSLLGYDISDDDNLYQNKLKAIDASIEYRVPKLKANRINGVIMAEIAGQEGGSQAYRPEDGNYQVKLPFEVVSDNNLYSSWVPRLGDTADSGNQTALKEGDTVLLGFMEGSPNRPVIIGEIDQRGTVLTENAEMVIKRNGYLKVVGKDAKRVFEEQYKKLQASRL